MRGIITSLVFSVALVSFAHAEDMEDVIYKTDGSILRGELIEQDFAAGKYKIRLMGGSVFSVNQDEISKITKEPVIVKRSGKDDSQATVNVQVNQSGVTNTNTNDNQQSQTQTVSNTQYPLPTEYKPETPAFPPHVISLGTATKSYKYEVENYYGDTVTAEEFYTGYTIAYQANFTEHVSAYVDYAKTEFRDVEISSSFGSTVLDADDLGIDDIEVTTYQAIAQLSTGTFVNKWQASAGIGAYRETAKMGSESDDAKGTVLMLSGGYSWKSAQVQLRYFNYQSNDYGDGFDSADNLSLQLGLNL